ncbi:MAG: hypothetical protein RDV48_13415 [Candidatus Eremiobacteraeota bacterium]|nr:hypothetical protein [Candidatus Eremiobacteraeota bacterium]
MSGINPIQGQYGMPDHQFKAAMVTTSAHAAQGTGTAKKHTESLETDHDEIHLSDKAQLDMTDDTAKAEQQQQEQKMQKMDQQDQQLQKQRFNQVSDKAAMAAGAKDRDYEKEAVKGKKHVEAAEGGDTLTDVEQHVVDLGQAHTAGVLDGDAKKLKGKRQEEDPLRRNAAEMLKEQYRTEGRIVHRKEQEVKPELIEKVLNRDPKEILANVPEQFKATAQMMVKGQVDPAGKPKESLVNLKPEPKTECSALELMPEKDHPPLGIFDECPPIPDLFESPAEV